MIGQFTDIRTMLLARKTRMVYMAKLLATMAHAAPCKPISGSSNHVRATTTMPAAMVDVSKYFVCMLAVNTVP